MAKEYFMPLFSVRASKSSEAHKQSLLMEKTHAKIQEAENVDTTRSGFPKSHIKPRKNNFVLVNSFPSTAHVLKEGITEEIEEENIGGVAMTSSSSSYGITHLFRRSSSKKSEHNSTDLASPVETSGYAAAKDDNANNVNNINSTSITESGNNENCIGSGNDNNNCNVGQILKLQFAASPRQHKHTGFRKLYKRAKKRKNCDSSINTSNEYSTPVTNNFINYTPDQYDSTLSTPVSPAGNARNRSTSTSSSHFTFKVNDIDSFDTSYSTPYHLEDDDVCSINTTSTKRMKSDRRSDSVVSLASAVDSPANTPNTGTYPTLRSVGSRNRLLSISSPSVIPPTSTASSVSLSSLSYQQPPQKSPSLQFNVPQMVASRSRSSSSAITMPSMPSSSIRITTPTTSISTPSVAMPVPIAMSVPAPTHTTTPATNSAPFLATPSAHSVPVTKGMNLDVYLNSLEAQRIQSIVSEQQQQILKQQLHHNDPIARNESPETQIQMQAQAQEQKQKQMQTPRSNKIQKPKDVTKEENEEENDAEMGEIPHDTEFTQLEELAGLGLMDLDLDMDMNINMNMDMKMSNINIDDININSEWNEDDLDDSIVQQIDQLINLARLEEFAKEMH